MKSEDNISSFLFVPDISGFSKFVNDTEVNHSRHIISELLEIIIQSDQLGLKVAEVEGDAVLFYRKEIPRVEEVLEQSKKTFLAFHHHLRKYEVLRICQCGACRSAAQLSLKFIAHSGNYSFIDVGGFHKPYGREVVTVHNLLKNSIPDTEYLLLTKDLLKHSPIPVDKEDWVIFNNGGDYYSEKSIEYSYIPLTHLYSFVPPVEHFELPQKTKKPIRLKVTIDQPIHKIHALLLDFDFKRQWNKRVTAIGYDSTRINRAGTRHTCTVESKDLHFKTITNDFGAGKWVYGEKLLNPPILKEADFYFILEEIGKQQTQISFELHYVPNKGVLSAFSWVFRFLYKKNFTTSLRNLQRLVNTNSFSMDHER